MSTHRSLQLLVQATPPPHSPIHPVFSQVFSHDVLQVPLHSALHADLQVSLHSPEHPSVHLLKHFPSQELSPVHSLIQSVSHEFIQLLFIHFPEQSLEQLVSQVLPEQVLIHPAVQVISHFTEQ